MNNNLRPGTMQEEELRSRISGLSKEEMLIALDCIPAEYCFTRLIKEFKNNQQTIACISGLIGQKEEHITC